ncbi:MAG TPA: TMEM175 family protein [Stellaceae bacterium]|jgi:uncharacterized membrane protein|nr:TMEM175 family protein [Stellaceae bacterium]
MREQKTKADRLGAFSDGVIAVIITVMVLELKAPEDPTFAALLPLWPTAISYAVSYLFIAIIWVNHHHLLHFVPYSTPRLIWLNFAHLFAVSLLPFATAWVARSHLAPAPVTVYGAIFVLVDIAYLVFEREVLAHADASAMPDHARRLARRRSIAALAIFAAATGAAPFVPLLSFGLICCALILYLRPEAIAHSAAPSHGNGSL